jgi:hypothetical protein
MRSPLRSGLAAVLFLCACNTKAEMRAPPAPIKSFPGDLLAGAVPVFPLNNLRVDSTARWDELTDKRKVTGWVDSILVAVLAKRYPTVRWVPAPELQTAAAKAPGMLVDPYQMTTIQLQTHALTTVPSNLLTQLRGVTAVASGGRYVVVPANLWFTATGGAASAHLVVALADVRIGAVSWSGTLTGVGNTPFKAVEQAVLALTRVKDQ